MLLVSALIAVGFWGECFLLVSAAGAPLPSVSAAIAVTFPLALAIGPPIESLPNMGVWLMIGTGPSAVH